MRENLADTFLSKIEEIEGADIPEEVFVLAEEALLDHLGVAFAGCKCNSSRIGKCLDIVGKENGGAAIPGLGAGFSSEEAALLEGLNAHQLDFDDGTNAGIIHLGSPVFSALMPLAQVHGASGEALLHAAVVGYEAAFTLAVSVQPEHKLRGFHATGTCGTVGAAMAIADLLSFSAEERRCTLAAACASATGMLMVLDDGSELKPYNAGKAAMLAVSAAQMGRARFRGPDDPLGGARGFAKIFGGKDECELADPLRGGTYALQKAYVKPYAACRYCHPAIEGAIAISREGGPAAGNVESVSVKTYALATRGHDHRAVRGQGSAKMSIPYGVAVGYLTGRAGLAEYGPDFLCDERILGLAGKVEVLADEGFSEAFPAEQIAEVTVRGIDGTSFGKRVNYPKGEPENPLSREEKISKFMDMAAYAGISPADARRTADAALGVRGDSAPLYEALREIRI